MDYKIIGWRLPATRGSYGWTVKTIFEDTDNNAEYPINMGAMVLTVNPTYYAMTITSDKSIASETGGLVQMKYILDTDFNIETDLFRVLVPPINKDFESFSG